MRLTNLAREVSWDRHRGEKKQQAKTKQRGRTGIHGFSNDCSICFLFWFPDENYFAADIFAYQDNYRLRSVLNSSEVKPDLGLDQDRQCKITIKPPEGLTWPRLFERWITLATG